MRQIRHIHGLPAWLFLSSWPFGSAFVLFLVWAAMVGAQNDEMYFSLMEKANKFVGNFLDIEHFVEELNALPEKVPHHNGVIWISLMSRSQLCFLNNYISWVNFGMVDYNPTTEGRLVQFVASMDTPTWRHCEELRTFLENETFVSDLQRNVSATRGHFVHNQMHLVCIRPAGQRVVMKKTTKKGKVKEKITFNEVEGVVSNYLGSTLFNQINWLRPALAYIAIAHPIGAKPTKIMVSDIDMSHLRYVFGPATYKFANGLERADERRWENLAGPPVEGDLPVFRMSKYELEYINRVVKSDMYTKFPYFNAGFFFAWGDLRTLANWNSYKNDTYYDQTGFNMMMGLVYQKSDHPVLKYRIVTDFTAYSACACRVGCDYFEGLKIEELSGFQQNLDDLEERFHNGTTGDEHTSHCVAASSVVGTSGCPALPHHVVNASSASDEFKQAWNNQLASRLPASVHYSCDGREDYKRQDMAADGVWRPLFPLPETECAYRRMPTNEEIFQQRAEERARRERGEL